MKLNCYMYVIVLLVLLLLAHDDIIPSKLNTFMCIASKILMDTRYVISVIKFNSHLRKASVKTHWGRVTHICVVKLTIVGSDNGLSPGRRQAIIWTNAGISLIGPLRTNFIENLIGIQTFSFKKMHLKMSSAKWRPFCLGLNVFNGFMVL